MLDDKELVNGVLERMRARVEGLGPSHVADARLAKMKAAGAAQVHQFAINAFDETANKLGVYCLSERPDDILMWSHYAACHRGIVVRFNMSKWPFRSFSQLWQVRYDASRPILTFQAPLDPNELFQALTRKSIVWGHEQEWRLLVQRKSREIIVIPEDCIDAVIIGSRTPIDTQKIVQSWTANRPAALKLFRALPRPTEYGLELVELDATSPATTSPQSAPSSRAKG